MSAWISETSNKRFLHRLKVGFDRRISTVWSSLRLRPSSFILSSKETRGSFDRNCQRSLVEEQGNIALSRIWAYLLCAVAGVPTRVIHRSISQNTPLGMMAVFMQLLLLSPPRREDSHGRNEFREAGIRVEIVNQEGF